MKSVTNSLIKLKYDLDRLIEACQNDTEPTTVVLSQINLAKFQALANETHRDSVTVLFDDIAAAPFLLEQIKGFLNTPVVEPVNGLPDILIRPEKFKSKTIARIGIQTDQVIVNFPEKHGGFLEIVKGLDYSWNESYWWKRVSNWQKAINAAAELGHCLLAAGFWIAPPTPKIRDLIIHEEFESEHRRKIMVRTKGNYPGWFCLWWTRSEDCYAAAKKITASRYDKPYIVVPPEYYDEVEDFARLYHFYITPTAQELIDRARVVLDAALLVQVSDDERIETDSDRPTLIAPEVVNIDDELADYD